MCDKCVEIDKAIERYQRILLSISDELTVDRTKELIADLQEQKAALHPCRKSKAASWVHCDIAGPAMEVGTILCLNDLEAIRDRLNGWRVVALSLRQTRRSIP
jgi:hypothetical protein